MPQAIEDAINGLKGQTTKLDKLNQAISDGTSAQAGSKYANSSAESKGALDQAIMQVKQPRPRVA